MDKPKFAWKVLCKGMKSNHGNLHWKKGKWNKVEGDLKLCEHGLHASKLCIDAMQYVTPGIICRIEYKGDIVENGNKFVAREMRVIEIYRFTKRMAVELAIYSAELCIKNFEKKYLNDKRPRQAIQAAKNWLKNPSKTAMLAARSAAESAELVARSITGSARSAAWSAAWSARSAWSTMSAVWSAAWSTMSAWSAWSARSARSAVWSAGSAGLVGSVAWLAWSAAESAVRSSGSSGSAVKQKIERKLLKIIGA